LCCLLPVKTCEEAPKIKIDQKGVKVSAYKVGFAVSFVSVAVSYSASTQF
jgi:hypothetical protein